MSLNRAVLAATMGVGDPCHSSPMTASTYLKLLVRLHCHDTGGILTIFKHPLSFYPQSDIASEKQNGRGGGKTDHDTDTIPIGERP